MKKLLFICFVIIFFSSCEKETEDCKICTTIITQSGGGYASGKVLSTSTFKACGNELKSVNGAISTATSGGITVTSKTTCK